MSTFMGVVAFLSSVTLLQEWRVRRRMVVAVSVALFAMSAAILIARAIYFLFAPPLADFFVSSQRSAFCRLRVVDRVLLRLVDSADPRAGAMAQQAAAADAAKSEFVETMNLEIRNPLGGVMAATELLLETDLTLEQQDYALAVRTEAETLLKVNGELLDLSRIETGQSGY